MVILNFHRIVKYLYVLPVHSFNGIFVDILLICWKLQQINSLHHSEINIMMFMVSFKFQIFLIFVNGYYVIQSLFYFWV